MFALTSAALIGLCVGAVVLDVKTRRLPNWLTIGALALALVLRAPEGIGAVGIGMASAGIAFAFGLPFFLVGGLGGGDVKLMAGLAAFLNPAALIPAMLVMAFTGALMALIAAMRKGALGQVLANLHVIVLSASRRTFFRWRREEELDMSGRSRPDAVTNPYGVAIACGALAGWFI